MTATSKGLTKRKGGRTVPAGRRTGLPSKAATSKGVVAPTLRMVLLSEVLTGRYAESARAELRALLSCAAELRDIKRARGHEDTCVCSMCCRLAQLRRVSSRGTP